MVVRDLTAVLDDGLPLGEGVPSNSRQVLRIPKGANVTVRVKILSRSGAVVPLDIAGGDAAQLTGRIRPNGETLFSIAATAGDTDETIHFVFTPSTLQAVQFGRGIYDLFIKRGSIIEPGIPVSPLIVESVVTDLA